MRGVIWVHCGQGWFILFVVSVFGFFVFATPAQAIQISGTISSTLTITDDSELVGDVTRTVAGAPCITFGAPGIKLRLNGFTITGTSTGCTPATSSDDGIDVIGLSEVAILGHGLVRAFGGFGIFLFGGSKVRVERVTISDSCGIFLGDTTDSDVEENVSVRNSRGSENGPCGGT